MRLCRWIQAFGVAAMPPEWSWQKVLNMNWREHIVTDPEILVGKPTIKDTRIPVQLVLGWLEQGWTLEMLLESYPALSRETVWAALAFAAEMMRDERYIAIHKAVRDNA